jgi:hypothetical protein
MTTKLNCSLFCCVLALGLAAPALAWDLNDNSEPGSVIVFHKFIRGFANNQPATQFEISATCPKDWACTGGQAVHLRAHWVCPPDSRSPTVCREQDFNLDVTVNGTVVFDAAGNGASSPPCDRGYLIAWVIDDTSTGNPIKFDALIGDAVIRASEFGARAYNALPIKAAEAIGTTQPTAADTGGALAFDGNHYRMVTGKIFGSVRYESTVPPVRTDLTLLTLDVHSNLPNELTSVSLNFYNEGETLESTATNFTCWTEQSLSAIDQNLNTSFGTKGLVESTSATQPSKGDVTLVGIVETEEDFTKTLPADATGFVTINLLDLNSLPVNCTRFTRPPICFLGICIPGVDQISCRVDTHTTVDFAGVRDYSYSLYDDSVGVPTTFEPR